MKGDGKSKGLQTALERFEDSLDKYMPVLMAQAKIIWEKGEYEQVPTTVDK